MNLDIQTLLTGNILDRFGPSPPLALDRHPCNEAQWRQIALGFFEKGDHQAATVIFEALLSVKHEPATAHFYLAMMADARGDRHAAIDHLEKAIQLEPRWEVLHFNLGTIQLAVKACDRAVKHFENALSIRTDWPEAWSNKGLALMKLQSYGDALTSLQNSFALDQQGGTRHITALNLGVCLEKLGRLSEAVAWYRRAVALQPDYALGWFNLAGALRTCGSMREVAACYGKAVELKPDWANAHFNLAVALRKLENLEQAIDHCRQAIRINPDMRQAHAYLLQLAQHACDWRLIAETASRMDRMTHEALLREEKTAESPMLSIRRHANPASNFMVARSWSRQIKKDLADSKDPPLFRHHGLPVSGRLRIGYLSADFKDHAVAHQIRGMLTMHDHKTFEIFGYASTPDDGSTYRNLLAGACDHFSNIHEKSDAQAARKIFDDRIQILVDLSGYSQGARQQITALRPAPIQVGYLGFLGTSGADFIDYIIADDLVVPQKHQCYYSENLVYLPHCYQANDDRMPIADRIFERNEFGLPEKGTVFCCFNQPYKIDARLFKAWMHILAHTDNSVLWLLKQSRLAQANLCRAAQQAAVDPARLVFAPPMSIDRHLARLKLADLALDTLIYNGGATTANALWAGVPVLTILGGHWVSRMSASALRAVGLSELIARDLDAYGRMAIDLAARCDRLLALRQKLAANRLKTPLFNTLAFTRHLETAFMAIWQRHSKGLPPAAFRVLPKGSLS